MNRGTDGHTERNIQPVTEEGNWQARAKICMLCKYSLLDRSGLLEVGMELLLHASLSAAAPRLFILKLTAFM